MAFFREIREKKAFSNLLREGFYINIAA